MATNYTCRYRGMCRAYDNQCLDITLAFEQKLAILVRSFVSFDWILSCVLLLS